MQILLAQPKVVPDFMDERSAHLPAQGLFVGEVGEERRGIDGHLRGRLAEAGLGAFR